MPDEQPVQWLKWKYARPKTKGSYKGGSNTAGTSRTKRKKVGGGPDPIEWVKVITASGRVRWDQRPREVRR